MEKNTSRQPIQQSFRNDHKKFFDTPVSMRSQIQSGVLLASYHSKKKVGPLANISIGDRKPTGKRLTEVICIFFLPRLFHRRRAKLRANECALHIR